MTVDLEAVGWTLLAAVVLAGGIAAVLAAKLAAAQSRIAWLEGLMEAERVGAAEKLALMEGARQRLSEEFRAVSASALAENNRHFMELARGDFDQKRAAVDAVVRPMREQMERFGEAVRALETERVGAYAALREQVTAMAAGQTQLRTETGNLVRALHAPATRGRWGEITLRRVVELVGMQRHCDFTEQTSVEGEAGRLRPDLIVNLPGGKSVVVDSKVALEAYLDALEAVDDAVRAEQLRRHARQTRAHVERLAGKAYWSQFDESPEIVVMFMPLETAFSAAIENDPGLIEWAVERRVIPASPMTLIALLQAVHYGWKQDRMSDNARLIGEVGRDLHDRLGTFADHLTKVGRGLTGATDSYNRAVGSLERMVLPKARQLKELGAASGGVEVGSPATVDVAVRGGGGDS
jgi:DNA recombination protein RmuC